jgi:hypothetical protein
MQRIPTEIRIIEIAPGNSRTIRARVEEPGQGSGPVEIDFGRDVPVDYLENQTFHAEEIKKWATAHGHFDITHFLFDMIGEIAYGQRPSA